MSESTEGILVLLSASTVVSLFFHTIFRSFAVACVVSAAIASVVFQVLAYFHAGYLDPFFVIALVVGGAVAYLVALVVGLPFLAYRRKQNAKT